MNSVVWWWEVGVVLILGVAATVPDDKSRNCRDRSIHLRQDGGLCFEIPPWQLQPVQLDKHLLRIRNKFVNFTSTRSGKRLPSIAAYNSEISRYIDTVIAPFLDTYHQNIQSAYQQITSKTLKSIKEFISSAVLKKNKIYQDLTKLADKLQVPAMCDEERRAIRTLASKHVAQMYYCTDEARADLSRMGKYAEEMISMTQGHMQTTINDVMDQLGIEQAKNIGRSTASSNVSSSLALLSRAAVALGYELDLSLTNARRHNEQTCERLTSCRNRIARGTDESVKKLKQDLDYCVYA